MDEVNEEGLIKASGRFCLARAVVFTRVVKSVPRCSRNRVGQDHSQLEHSSL
jgi:hypothetical protein